MPETTEPKKMWDKSGLYVRGETAEEALATISSTPPTTSPP